MMRRNIMISPRRAGQLLASDWINIRRDPTLLSALAAAMLMILILWRLAPWLDQRGLAAFGWHRSADYAAAFGLCMPALLIGWITGFLFLEERDDGPMAAIAVTSIGLAGLAAFRLCVAMALTAGLTFLGCLLLQSGLGFGVSLSVALLGGVQAASIALLLPALARNKVEGLALIKVINITALVPLLAILDSPFKYLAAIVPSYWIGELLALAPVPMPPLLALLFAVPVHGLVFVAVYRWAGHGTRR